LRFLDRRAPRVPARQYVEAIRAELDMLGPAGPLETLYLGGGTPSATG
jgi:coproporphyrinogen III oxidase-like Fe-S oxidoreductase